MLGLVPLPRKLASVLQPASSLPFMAILAVRDCLIADNCLQRRYSTRNYRASLTRIGLPPIHQACLERVQHLAATARRRREAKSAALAATARRRRVASESERSTS